MSADRYVLLVLSKGATVHECRDCGAVVFHRLVHDAWHAVNEAEALRLAQLVDDVLGRSHVQVVADVGVDADLDAAYLAAQLTAHRAIREYRSDARRN
jgi:hypothetical protein